MSSIIHPAHLAHLDYKGVCPICSRGMYDSNASIDRHHFVPKCKGGKETDLLHVCCHRKIHSLFSEGELMNKYSNAQEVLSHPEIQKFVKWISKKDPLYNDHHKDHRDRKKRRGR